MRVVQQHVFIVKLVLWKPHQGSIKYYMLHKLRGNNGGLIQGETRDLVKGLMLLKVLITTSS